MSSSETEEFQDPSTSKFVASFSTSCDYQYIKLGNHYHLVVNASFKDANPGGTIELQTVDDTASSVSQSFEKGAVTQTVKTNFSAKTLSDVWRVKLTFQDGSNYERKLYFSNSAVFPKTGDPIDLPQLFPEQKHPAYSDRTDLGVCLSGGGTRAMVLGMGQLRFLDQTIFKDNKSYLQHSGYLSAVSGGSWAATIYTYSQYSTGALLGYPVKPEDYDKTIYHISVPIMSIGGMTGLFLWQLIPGIIGLAGELTHALKSIFGKGNESTLAAIESYLKSFKTPPLDRIWIDAVGGAFFYPNNIYNKANPNLDAFTLDESSKKTILNRSGSLKTVLENLGSDFRTVYQRNGYPPYLVLNSLMLRPSNKPYVLPGKLQPPYISYEYTPLYQGAGFTGTWPQRSEDIGGGNLDMFSYGTQRVVPSGTQMTLMHESHVPLPSLAVASGTSSSAFAGFTSTGAVSTFLTWGNILKSLYDLFSSEKSLSDLMPESTPTGLGDTAPQTLTSDPATQQLLELDKSGQLDLSEILKALLQLYTPDGPYTQALDSMTPKANYMPVSTIASPTNFPADFGDAGLSDNFGLMAMLRRKVAKVIIFVNSEKEFIPKGGKDDKGNTLSETQIDLTVPAFFGQADDASFEFTGARLNGMQVFKDTQLADLEKQLADCIANKQPLVAVQNNLDVLPNEHWGVTEGKVSVFWVYNSMSPVWEAAAGEEVLKKVNPLNSILGKFPFYSTIPSTISGLLPIQINTLANLAHWNLEQSKGKLDAFLNG